MEYHSDIMRAQIAGNMVTHADQLEVWINMRLFLRHGSTMSVVVVEKSVTFDAFKKMCAEKTSASDFLIVLDVDGHPLINSLDVLQNNDCLILKEVVAENRKRSMDNGACNVNGPPSKNPKTSTDDDGDLPPNTSSNANSPYMQAKIREAEEFMHSPASAIGSDVMERIRNILKRGLHPNTPESEAVQAMRLANKLLDKYNLDQAKVLGTSVDDSEAGMFKVDVTYFKTNKPATSKKWCSRLAFLCHTHFTCKSFCVSKYKPPQCFYAFYGLKVCALTAASAFVNAFNRIMFLSSKHTVPKSEYDLKQSEGTIKCSFRAYETGAKESYCEGLVRGLISKYKQSQDNTVDDNACSALIVRSSVAEKRALELSKFIIHHKKKKYTASHARQASFNQGTSDSKTYTWGKRIFPRESDLHRGKVPCTLPWSSKCRDKDIHWHV